MKLFKILSIILLTIFVTFFFLKIKLIFLNGEKIKYKNFNFQGIECIDDIIYIISDFDHKIYKLSENFKLEEFFETSIIYKSRSIFSHITSFFIKKGVFHGVNSMDKVNGVMVKVPIIEIENKKKLLSSSYEVVSLKTNNNHIDFYFDEDQQNEIIISHNQSVKNDINQISIKINNELKCKIKNKLIIQNLYYDKKTKSLFIVSNLFRYYVGIIYKLPIENICEKNILSFFNIKNKEVIVFPFYELEGYAVCKNKEFYVYIKDKNSYIYYE